MGSKVITGDSIYSVELADKRRHQRTLIYVIVSAIAVMAVFVMIIMPR